MLSLDCMGIIHRLGGGIDENSVLRLFYYKLIEVQLLSV